MTVTKKKILPALHDSGKVRNSDLNEIGEKNYTATILKYASLAVNVPQLNTNAKTVVGAINELYAHPGGSTVIPNPPIEGVIELEQGGSIELEQGGVLETEQGGGSVVGDLTSISIDGDIYTIPSGGGTTVIPNSPSGSQHGVLNILTIDDTNYTVSGFSGKQNITLYPDRWTSQSYGYSQTITGLSLQNADIIFVNPVSYDFLVYCKCGIYCYSNTGSSITFRCTTKPTNNIGVNIAYCKGRISS